MALVRWSWVVVVAACGPAVDSPQDPDTTGGETDVDPSAPTTEPSDTLNTTEPDPSDTDPSDTDPTGTVPTTRSVDVLFVVDNSGTMGEEQGRLATAAGGLVTALDGAGLDWRIGITTTDNGNPWCGSTSPEAGKLIASSCLGRTGEFVFNGNPPQDATAVACTDICQTEAIEILPTDSGDGQLRPRPWLERTAGALNVEIDPAQALACMLPQGISGCGFEAPLESMYKMILRTQNEGEEELGFIRPEALLVIVFISDETDCSYNNEHQSIFLPESEGGSQVFWSDPDASAPTSAVCWNAGVTCSGDPSQYETCRADNKDVNGNTDVSDDDAVLLPISRYVDQLQAIEAIKQELDPAQQVLVVGITGVPNDYVLGNEVVYAAAADPETANNFGISPGCSGDTGNGVPPVRELAVAAAMSTTDRAALFSVCDADYQPTIASINALVLSYVGEG